VPHTVLPVCGGGGVPDIDDATAAQPSAEVQHSEVIACVTPHATLVVTNLGVVILRPTHVAKARGEASLDGQVGRAGAACVPLVRVRVEIMGSQKCRIVGKSQSVLIMIDPIIFTRTRSGSDRRM
jgi:hypothetical protein